jgi:CheY-like chemotaxis protein
MPKTVLLADDSVTIRKVVELTFSDTDIRVESVANGREALERIEAIAPDLVLADVEMPEPSGYEVCRTIKASPHPVPVLLLAGTFEPFDPERARACGADGHVVKPFESASLLERVTSLLEQPPPVARAVDVPAVPELEAVLDEFAGHPPEPVAAPALEPPEAAAALGTAEPAPAGVRLPSGVTLSVEDLDAIARAVVERLSVEPLREIAWEVVPDLADAIIRERIRQLEREAER